MEFELNLKMWFFMGDQDGFNKLDCDLNLVVKTYFEAF